MKWCNSWKRAILVPMDRIGDAVSDTPAISYLKSLGIEIIVLATPYTTQIFENNPNIYRCITFSRKSRDGILSSALTNRLLIKDLKKLNPDVVISMMRQIRELKSIFSNLSVPVLAKPQDNNLPIYMRWVEFFRALNLNVQPAQNEIYPNDQDKESAVSWARKTGIDLDRPSIVVHPGCAVYKNEKDITNSLRSWDLDNYLEVFSHLPNDIQIILTGVHPAEKKANSYIQKRSPRTTAIFDIPNIRAMAWVIARSKLVITLDTGTLHIAAATDTPIIGLFGPSDPGKYGPWRKNITYVRTGQHLSCWPCDQNATCGGNNICMASITPEDVLDAVRGTIQ